MLSRNDTRVEDGIAGVRIRIAVARRSADQDLVVQVADLEATIEEIVLSLILRLWYLAVVAVQIDRNCHNQSAVALGASCRRLFGTEETLHTFGSHRE